MTGGTPVIIHGASASVLGVVAAAATRSPQRRVRLLLFGSVRLVHLVIVFLVLDLLFVTRSSTAVFAHIGGALSGWLIVRIERRGIDLTGWTRIFVGRRTRRRSEFKDWLGRMEQRLAQTRSSDGDIRPVFPPTVDAAELMQRDVDRVLDKISRPGLRVVDHRGSGVAGASESVTWRLWRSWTGSVQGRVSNRDWVHDSEARSPTTFLAHKLRAGGPFGDRGGGRGHGQDDGHGVAAEHASRGGAAAGGGGHRAQEGDGRHGSHSR